MTTTRSKIQAIFNYQAGAQDYLDGLVLEHATQMAKAINNDGIKAQLEFLENHRAMNEETVLKLMQEAVCG